eukprot:TRINITY_DN27888_c0_g1_i1.p1 TRINITY_DN27888_c0_g1~~TRINITY_DN27888_c0_g1_i1.p1  ORF type:complete len:165 (-),score=34.16 TRINITY_DN27888_c0_g1_i1:181-675(-)
MTISVGLAAFLSTIAGLSLGRLVDVDDSIDDELGYLQSEEQGLENEGVNEAANGVPASNFEFGIGDANEMASSLPLEDLFGMNDERTPAGVETSSGTASATADPEMASANNPAAEQIEMSEALSSEKVHENVSSDGASEKVRARLPPTAAITGNEIVTSEVSAQ